MQPIATLRSAAVQSITAATFTRTVRGRHGNADESVNAPSITYEEATPSALTSSSGDAHHRDVDRPDVMDERSRDSVTVQTLLECFRFVSSSSSYEAVTSRRTFRKSGRCAARNTVFLPHNSSSGNSSWLRVRTTSTTVSITKRYDAFTSAHLCASRCMHVEFGGAHPSSRTERRHRSVQSRGANAAPRSPGVEAAASGNTPSEKAGLHSQNSPAAHENRGNATTPAPETQAAGAVGSFTHGRTRPSFSSKDAEKRRGEEEKKRIKRRNRRAERKQNQFTEKTNGTTVVASKDVSSTTGESRHEKDKRSPPTSRFLSEKRSTVPPLPPSQDGGATSAPVSTNHPVSSAGTKDGIEERPSTPASSFSSSSSQLPPLFPSPATVAVSERRSSHEESDEQKAWQEAHRRTTPAARTKSKRHLTPLPRLLQQHGTIRKNYTVLQRSGRVYASFCRVCLEGLESSGLVQRVAMAGAAASRATSTRAGSAPPPSPPLSPSSSSSHALEDVSLTSEKARSEVVELCVYGEAVEDGSANCSGEEASAFTTRLPLSAVRWLATPVTVPDVAIEELLQLVTCAPDAADAHTIPQGGCGRDGKKGRTAPQRGGTATVSGVPPAWREAWWSAAEGVVPFPEAALLRCFELPTATPIADLDTVLSLFSVLQSVAFFRRTREEVLLQPLLASSSPSSTRATTGDDASIAPCVLSTDPTRAAQVAACVTALQLSWKALDNPAPSKEGTDTGLEHAPLPAAERLARKQTVLRRSQELLQALHKVDQLERVHHTESHDETGAQVIEGGTAAAPEPVLSYRVHVLDVLFHLLFRCLLPHWPRLPPPQRSQFMRFAAMPWFSLDLTPSLATWYTYTELSRCLSSRPVTQPAGGAPSGDAAGRSATSSHGPPRQVPVPSDIVYYTQVMRSLCVPTLLDHDSPIIGRVLGGEQRESATDGASTASAPKLKDVLAVLFSSEKKQRLAYELLYLFFWGLSARALPSDVTEDARTYPAAAAVAVDAHVASDAASDQRAFITSALYAMEVDRFVMERFYARLSNKSLWLLQPYSSSSLRPLSPHDENPPGVVPWSAWERDLHRQCIEPYALTRLAFYTVSEPLPVAFTTLSAGRTSLLFEAWLRAVGLPSQHALNYLCFPPPPSTPSDVTPDEDESAKARRAGFWVWTQVLSPLQPLVRSVDFQRAMLPLLIRDIHAAPQEWKDQFDDAEKAARLPGQQTHSNARTESLCRPANVEHLGVMDRLVQVAHVCAFCISGCVAEKEEKRKEEEEEEGRRSGSAASSVPHSSSTAAHASPVHSVVQNSFTDCVEELLAVWTECHSGPTSDLAADAAERLLCAWPAASPSQDRLPPLCKDEDEARRWSAAEHTLQHTIFPSPLRKRVEDWLRKRRVVHQREARLTGVSDPVLRKWYGQMLDEDVGLRESGVRFSALFEHLWRLVTERATSVSADTTECTAAAFSAAELPIVLRALSTAYTHCNFTSSGRRFESVFDVMAAVAASRATASTTDPTERGGEAPLSPTTTMPRSSTSTSASAVAPDDTVVGVECKERARRVEVAIGHSLHVHHATLSWSTLIDAVFVRLLPLNTLRRYALHGNGDGEETATADELASRYDRLREALHREPHTRQTAHFLLLQNTALLSSDTQASSWRERSEGGRSPPQCGRIAAEESEPLVTQSTQDVLREILQGVVASEVAAVHSHAMASRASFPPTATSETFSTAPDSHASSSGRDHHHHHQNSSSSTSGGGSIVATAPGSRPPTLWDHIKTTAVTHSLVTYIYLQFGDAAMLTSQSKATTPCRVRRVPPPSKAAKTTRGAAEAPFQTLREVRMLPLVTPASLQLAVLYATLLHRVRSTLPARPEAHVEELLLYLTTVTTLCLNLWQQPSQRSSSASGPSFSGRVSTSAFTLTPPASDLLTYYPPVQLFEEAGARSESAWAPLLPQTCSDECSRVGLLAWGAHLITRLHAGAVVAARASRFPHLRRLTLLMVCSRAADALSDAAVGENSEEERIVTAPSSSSSYMVSPLSLDVVPLESHLHRLSESRRLVQHHLRWFFYAAAAYPVTSTALLSVAQHLREARDILSCTEVEQACVMLANAAEAFTVANNNDTDYQRQRERERGQLMTTFTRVAPPSAAAGNAPAKAAVAAAATHHGESRVVRQQQGSVVSMRSLPPQLRQAWAALAKRLVGWEAETVPLSTLLAALHCGAVLRCTDTSLFEQLLAVLVASDGALLTRLDVEGWAVVLQVCGMTVPELRRDLVEMIREPVLQFLTSSAEEGRGEGGGESHLRAAALGAARAQLLEALGDCFIESDAFWVVVRHVVQQWCTASDNSTSSCPPLSPPPPPITTNETTAMAAPSSLFTSHGHVATNTTPTSYWSEQWRRSFNWAVRVAGHGHMVLPLVSPPCGVDNQASAVTD